MTITDINSQIERSLYFILIAQKKQPTLFYSLSQNLFNFLKFYNVNVF